MKIVCVIILPSQEDNILNLNQYIKSDKTLQIIYADLESLNKNTDRCEIYQKSLIP